MAADRCTSPAPRDGFVALVGAGPGDPELLTLKAARHLARADVVLVDALVNPAVLSHCRPGVRVVPVGKLGGGPQTPQALIHAHIEREARAGHYVVRLKGGDPFLFGRGGEEALFCEARGIGWEVVPGVSSALAVPAAAGIPVTHRGVATHVTVISGTVLADAEAHEARWTCLARAGGTLVFLMALGRLDAVRARLLAAGLAPDTPAAALQDGTLPTARAVYAPLSELPEAVAAAALGSPALVVVGDVVGVAAELGVPAAVAGLAAAPPARAAGM